MVKSWCLSHYRRVLIQERSRVRNRVQEVIDSAGLRIGGILADVFGANGRKYRSLWDAARCVC